jgi:hypothetical protein
MSPNTFVSAPSAPRQTSVTREAVPPWSVSVPSAASVTRAPDGRPSI